MKNFLKRFEDGETQFFVMKSYITATFEVERKKEEYHIFFIKKNSNPDAYCQGYMNLKTRRMNRKEVKYFLNNKSNYHPVLDADDGTVYNLNSRPFDKSQCPTYRQFVLSL
jgi:hypothetical protein